MTTFTFAQTVDALEHSLLYAIEEILNHSAVKSDGVELRPMLSLYCRAEISAAYRQDPQRQQVLCERVAQAGWALTLEWRSESVGLLKRLGVAVPATYLNDQEELARPQLILRAPVRH